MINYAAGHLTSATAMSGKYVVTLVLSGLPVMHADGSALLSQSVSVPNGANPIMVTGPGLQGYITVTNTTPTTTTTTAATTTTTAATTTTTSTVTTTTLPPVLSFGSDTISIIDGTTTAYSLAAFQSSAGISMPWPSNTAALQFTLGDTSTFVPASGVTVTAAISLVDQTSGSVGQIRAFVDNVRITRGSGNAITVTVLPSPSTWFYGLSSDGLSAASAPFSTSVSGLTNTMSTGLNSIGLSGLVNAVNNASTGGLFQVTGKKYAVTLVLTGLDLYQSNASLFPSLSITVPTSLSGASSKVVSGRGVTGFITLN
jgi:hypothetical protein